MHTTRSDSIQLTTFFCLTKYELVRTTKFTRLVLPLLYVKRFEKNSPSVMFSNQYACVRSLLVKHRTDCPPLLRRFSIARMHIMAYIHTKEYTLEYYVHRDKNNESIYNFNLFFIYEYSSTTLLVVLIVLLASSYAYYAYDSTTRELREKRILSRKFICVYHT